MTYNIVLNPKYEYLRPRIEEIVKSGRPSGYKEIYRGRNFLYRCDIGDIPVVVKELRAPNIINSYVYTTLRKSKAARSFENASRMIGLGFMTPEPIAYAEVRNGMKLAGSLYISRELGGATEMRNWETFPFKDSLLTAFAQEISRLHQKGVFHKDFSPGNVLFTGNERDGYRFHYVDLNRMKFDERDRSRLMRMFRAINLNPDALGELARKFADVTGQDRSRIEEEVRCQLDGYFSEQRRKRGFKSFLKVLGLK